MCVLECQEINIFFYLKKVLKHHSFWFSTKIRRWKTSTPSKYSFGNLSDHRIWKHWCYKTLVYYLRASEKWKAQLRSPAWKKSARPPQHRWCTQRETSPQRGNNITGSTLQQRKIPGRIVSAAPQDPLTMEEVSLQADGIKEHAYSFCSVLNPCQVLTLQNRERMRQRWGPWDGTGEMQPRLPARWGQHMSIPWGLIMAPEWWRHHHVPIWRKRWGSGPGKAEMLRRGLMCCTQTSQAVPGKQIPQCCPLLLEKQTTRTGGGRWRKQLTLSLTQTVKFWQKLRLKNHCLRHTSKIITAALF